MGEVGLAGGDMQGPESEDCAEVLEGAGDAAEEEEEEDGTSVPELVLSDGWAVEFSSCGSATFIQEQNPMNEICPIKPSTQSHNNASRVLCKHSNGERASPANLKSTTHRLLVDNVVIV